jgi:hypothetical protein
MKSSTRSGIVDDSELEYCLPPQGVTLPECVREPSLAAWSDRLAGYSSGLARDYGWALHKGLAGPE